MGTKADLGGQSRQCAHTLWLRGPFWCPGLQRLFILQWLRWRGLLEQCTESATCCQREQCVIPTGETVTRAWLYPDRCLAYTCLFPCMLQESWTRWPLMAYSNNSVTLWFFWKVKHIYQVVFLPMHRISGICSYLFQHVTWWVRSCVLVLRVVNYVLIVCNHPVVFVTSSQKVKQWDVLLQIRVWCILLLEDMWKETLIWQKLLA